MLRLFANGIYYLLLLIELKNHEKKKKWKFINGSSNHLKKHACYFLNPSFTKSKEYNNKLLYLFNWFSILALSNVLYSKVLNVLIQ